MNGAEHASALGHTPAEYEEKVVRFLQDNDNRRALPEVVLAVQIESAP